MEEEILNWIIEIQNIDGTPPSDVIAFNFGIFESDTGYKIYCVGSFEYDENNDDWACIELPSKPYRYLDIPPKFQTYTWDKILKICSNSLEQLEKNGKLNIDLLKNAIAITTGFDDGELIKIR